MNTQTSKRLKWWFGS